MTFCEIRYDGVNVYYEDIKSLLLKKGFLRKKYVIELFDNFNKFTIKRLYKYNERGYSIKNETFTDLDLDNFNRSKVIYEEKYVFTKLYNILINKKKYLSLSFNHDICKKFFKEDFNNEYYYNDEEYFDIHMILYKPFKNRTKEGFNEILRYLFNELPESIYIKLFYILKKCKNIGINEHLFYRHLGFSEQEYNEKIKDLEL